MLRFLIVLLIGGCPCNTQNVFYEIHIENGKTLIWNIHRLNNSNDLDIDVEHSNIVAIASNSNSIVPNTLELSLTGLAPGKSQINIIWDTNFKNDKEDVILHVQVHRSEELAFISIICGWLYFVAWSVCFYPQVYQNYSKKSVVGLNFDCVLFGVVGYGLYHVFNLSMVYIPLIKRQYSKRYPHGITPVLTNDLVFSLHSIGIMIIISFQCLIYDRAKQTVSNSARILVALFIVAVGVSIVLALLDIILWLDVVYLCSYIKMYSSILLYLPQAYMNYKRKSTSGYNIIGVLIDFVGGIFCQMQLFMDAYNYDDWKTVIENPTKFGLSVIALGVSIVFIIQHYVLYPERTKNKEESDS